MSEWLEIETISMGRFFIDKIPIKTSPINTSKNEASPIELERTHIQKYENREQYKPSKTLWD